nr:hypothetical protein [Oscillospiraceae bacterium]
MSVYLRLGGAALITLCAVFVGREYSSFADRRLSQLRGFLALISHFEREISKSLAFGDGLWRGFNNGALSECGFLTALMETGSLSEAFSLCEDSLSLSKEQSGMLCGFFSGFGSNYKDGELRRIGEFRAELDAVIDRESDNLAKSVSVTKALLLGSGLAAAVMVI